jgi:serine/threonine protein kinase
VLTAVPSRSLIPQLRIGPLTLRHPLEKGGLSQLWVADLDTEGPATKRVVFKSPTWHEDDFREMAIRAVTQEATALTLLNHPQIPDLHGVFDHEGVPTLAIEYVSGRNLQAVQSSSRALTSQAIIQIGLKIARALCHVHDAGVVHRDIKPGNIMVTEDLTDVWLIDFGICDTPFGAFANIEGMLAATPAFAPPELYRRVASQPFDIFSLGATMFALFMRQGPYLSEDPVEIAIRAQAGRIARPAETIPRGLGQLIEQCLEFHPDNRPTAHEVASTLLELRAPRHRAA